MQHQRTIHGVSLPQSACQIALAPAWNVVPQTKRLTGIVNARPTPTRSTTRAQSVADQSMHRRIEVMSVATNSIAQENLANEGFIRERVLGLVRDILERRSVGREILDDDDLRDAGLNSLDMVNLMLAVEAEFDLKIPDADMTLRNFRSVSAIDALVAALLRAR